jgi:hypothetical protein
MSRKIEEKDKMKGMINIHQLNWENNDELMRETID